MQHSRLGSVHTPVMLKEIISIFQRQCPKNILDGTFGGGGHSRALLENIKNANISAVDRDMTAIKRALPWLESFNGRLALKHGRFSAAPLLFPGVTFDGILLDLGTSTDQLSEAERGFSFRLQGPLDMRMDQQSEITAADIINWYSEDQLAEIFLKFGEESHAKKIAHEICVFRKKSPIRNTKELADLVEALIPGKRDPKSGSFKHPATKIFQAIRILVNSELHELDVALPLLFEHLSIGGFMCIISFHALEDALVKKFFRSKLDSKTTSALASGVKTLQFPSLDELQSNRNARSARLRCFKKIAH